ncbi:hypothetical protein, partial [Hallella sp.]
TSKLSSFFSQTLFICTFEFGNMANRASVRHVPQLNTCLTPNGSLLFGDPIAQKGLFRSLDDMRILTNFSDRKHNKTTRRLKGPKTKVAALY